MTSFGTKKIDRILFPKGIVDTRKTEAFSYRAGAWFDVPYTIDIMGKAGLIHSV